MRRAIGKLVPISAVFAIGAIVVTSVFDKPRVLPVDEVRVAYWAWRTNAPDRNDIENAFISQNRNTLFIRAGQIDVDKDKKLRRIRPVEGRIPSQVDLHLVYNATPQLLRSLDSIDVDELAKTIAATYEADLIRSRDDESAQISGVQLDLDFPTRLLPRYTALLDQLRHFLPSDIKLSITGLPAWMASYELTNVLAHVDFWIPQCYGGEIPMHISRRVPISSTSYVARTIDQARRLGKPFYAGLAAYSYAILYGKDGNLIELRGNIDPAAFEIGNGLEQTGRRSFSKHEAASMRYEYLARNDRELDGLAIDAGQTVVLDVPSSALLRASARAVREKGGENLLGICLFRLPTPADPAVLTIDEVNAALADTETKVSTSVSLLKLDDGRLYVEVNNVGTASTMLGKDAFIVDIEIPDGSHGRLDISRGFHTYHTFCQADSLPPKPCSAQRANVLRLEARSWRVHDGGFATIDVKGPLPPELTIRTTSQIDDGRTHTETFQLPIQNNEPRKTKK
jgi:hypothetical protein